MGQALLAGRAIFVTLLGLALGGAPPALTQRVLVDTQHGQLAAPQHVSLAGWFHIIWNGGPRYVLIDAQGRWTELVLDDSLAKPFGGSLALNRKRVTIVGERVSAPPGALRVVSIELR
jgi:hypothetical protein